MIECVDVGKVYRLTGRPPVRALDALSLRAARGEVVGIAGPNGAGKSTLISLLLGYLHPTAGTVRLDGRGPRAYIESHGIGYLSELISVPPRWRTDEALVRYGLLAGVPETTLRGRVDELVALLGLEEHRAKPIRALSKGNLQRFGLAQALLADPDLLILDEPTHGFDPMWTARFRDLIANSRRPSRTVLIASHDLAELSALADRVYILDQGKVARVVDTRSAAPATNEYRLSVVAGADEVTRVFPNARAVSDGIFVLPAVDTETLNLGVAELVRRGARLTSVAPAESALEYHFREVVEESNS